MVQADDTRDCQTIQVEGGRENLDSDAITSSIFLPVFGSWLWDGLIIGAAPSSQVKRSMAFLLTSVFSRHFGCQADQGGELMLGDEVCGAPR
jgi:hypothetical protein